MASLLEIREDPKLELAVEVLRRGHTVRLKAWGTSMLPSIWPGDLLTIQGTGYDEVVPGDIVVLLRRNRFVIHRLVERQRVQGRTLWITKGDAISHNDPRAVATSLLGRVARIQRGQHSFIPCRRVSLFSAVMARTLFRSNRFCNLALRIHSARQQAGPKGTAELLYGVSPTVRSRTSPR